MATSRPTGNLLDIIERHSRDIRRLRAKLAGESHDHPHDHDADYSAITHDHDTEYSALTHDHDATYLNVSGDTMQGALGMGGNDITDVVNFYANSSNGDFVFRKSDGTIVFFWDESLSMLRAGAPVDEFRIPDILRFASDTNTRMERSAGDTFRFVTGGSEILKLTGSVEFGGTAFYGSSSGSASVTTIRHVLNTDGWAWHTRSGGSPLFLQRTDGNGSMIGLIRGTTVIGEIAQDSASIIINQGGAESGKFRSNNVYLTGARDNTTGSSPNTLIQSADGRIFRTTSSLRYKEDWQFVDENVLADLDMPQPIAWQDEQGGTMLGFGTEHIQEMLGNRAVQDWDENGNPQNYDVRSLVAILSAKVKRLETRLLQLGSE